MSARSLALLLPSLLLPAFAWSQADDISVPGRSDPSLVQVAPPPAESDPNARKAGQPSTADLQGKVKFHSQSILVQVPIVVTDKSGNHLHGLTKADFQILENGKEEKIATFEEIVAMGNQLAAVAPRPGEFSNLTLSDQQPRPVAVIALDTINTPFLAQANGRRELFKYLAENLNSNQVLALVIITSRGVKVVQGLTDDHAHLLQALKTASGEQPALLALGPNTQANAVAGDIPDSPTAADLNRPYVAAASAVARGDTITAQVRQQDAIEQTLNAFLEIAWFLSGVPGHKSLIWATGGFPFDIASAAELPGGNPQLYERAMQAFDAAQISVYPVDVRGLVANEMSAAVGASTGQEIEHQINNQAVLQRSLISTFNQVADMTGGKAFYNTNDLASSFQRAADDASSYYLAGYYLDTHNNNAGWRELKVRVNKKDAEIRARNGFYVTNLTMNLDLTRASDLSYALSSPIEGTGVPLTVKWLGTTGEGAKKKTEFMIHLPPGSVSIEAIDGKKHVNFDFAAAAYLNDSKADKPALTTGKSVTTAVPDAQMPTVLARGIDMKNAIQLGPGDYLVRVVIRDNVTGRIGSVTAPLTVN